MSTKDNKDLEHLKGQLIGFASQGGDQRTQVKAEELIDEYINEYSRELQKRIHNMESKNDMHGIDYINKNKVIKLLEDE